ncbi:hypothetical protein I3843_Q029300 [Carya illinoinensis]|nr:hypothetical protein I3843_Q029300 [Carya illinoinensis]
MVKALYGKQLVGMDDMDWKELEVKAMATIKGLGSEPAYQHVDVKFEDEDKALMLLNSLPNSPTYENLVTTLMWGKETLELEEITSALLGFHQRKKANDENSQSEGLVVKGNQERGRNKSRSGSSKNKARSKSRKRKDITCFKCRTKGHIKRDCPEKKKGNIENKKGPSKSATVVKEEDSESDDRDVLSVSFSSDHLADSWILDSAFGKF